MVNISFAARLFAVGLHTRCLRTENHSVVGSIPTGGTSDKRRYADLAHLVERHLAKVEVAGSSPVIRSKQNPLSKEGGFLFVLFVFENPRLDRGFREGYAYES